MRAGFCLFCNLSFVLVSLMVAGCEGAPSKRFPIITWGPLAPVPSGTVLGSTQLNATANVPGTFTYLPGPGTELNSIGTANLSVTFTPTDAADHPASATNSLNVFDRRLPATIQHVVVIMQENRSFDNLFNGFPGADTAQSGMSYGTPVPLQPDSLKDERDVDHSHHAWVTDWDNGKMDGFTHPGATHSTPSLPYAYVPQSETAPLWAIASAFTLGDRMFQSNSGPSFPAHQYMISGQSGEADENPFTPDKAGNGSWGCDSAPHTTVALLGPNGTDLPGVFPCFDYPTMADLLDSAGISWSYYAPSFAYIWSAFDAIHHIRYGSDWMRNMNSPSQQILTDIRKGKLAQVSWVVPDFSYSDHAGTGATGRGPDWVASIVNAIGASPYWNSTLILISWDDWGGWYDHVPPPQADNMGLGFRVPLIVVSPWAQHSYISHSQHEFGSFLKLTEEIFSLPSLGTRDVLSDDLSDCLNFDQTPPPFTPIPTLVAPQYFLEAKQSPVPPDDD
jgi:phospholipase C